MAQPTTPPGRRPPPKIAYKVMNPVFKTLLRSPLHSLISQRLVVLTFKGRKTGREYSTPLAYTQVDPTTVLIATQAPWWKNLRGGAPVRLRLRGKERAGVAEVITDVAAMQASFRPLLAGAPHLAEILGIRLTPQGEPYSEDVAAAKQRGCVIIEVRLNQPA